MKRLTPEQKAEMIELYTSGQIKVPKKLDEKYNIFPGSCYNLLKRRGLIKYSIADQLRCFNENYFDKIESEKQAYFLGLIAADGTVSSSKNTISITLKVEDGLYLLEELKKEISSTGKISIYNDKRDNYVRKPMCMMQFTSMHTKTVFCELGISPNKTSNLCYPKINKELDRHFIRGFIDGDGSFHYKRGILVFALVGTEEILRSIQDIFYTEINVEYTKLIQHITGVYYLRLGHKNTLKLREWLYKDCSVAMKRKQNYNDRL
jgi:intein/homing endonuclease